MLNFFISILKSTELKKTIFGMMSVVLLYMRQTSKCGQILNDNYWSFV